jgi:hypothetical protein
MTSETPAVRKAAAGAKARKRTADESQNDNYVSTADHHLAARDFSRPHTIPKEEFEEATGLDHEQAVADFQAAQKENEPPADDEEDAA